MTTRPHIPRATYRLQLNRHFTFKQAAEIVPYLSALGISHAYLSPCLKARPGSMHGYDIVDHNSFNPEIGTSGDFEALVETLHRHEMGLIMDIVPNHMAVMGSDNAWWLDVLENGQASIYSNFFDIEWQPLKDELRGKILVPVLHDHYGAVLESGELRLTFDCSRGDFNIFYREHRFPVNPREYPRILQRCAGPLAAQLGEQNPDVLEFQSLIAAFGHLPARQETGSDLVAERARDKEIHKQRLAALCGRCPEIAECILPVVELINGNPADPSTFEDLHELIKAQAFRLANWRVASDDINYRRFFDTNDLAGLCMESDRVFEATHRLVLKLIADGKVDGLRIDHPDGLYDPAQYFEHLRRNIAAARNETDSDDSYVVIEKILTGAERLPEEWAVSGTTGYDFANLVNGLFVEPTAAMRLERVYRNVSGQNIPFEDIAYRCRKLIMRVALASELNVLADHLARIALSKRRTCDFTLNGLRDALSEVVACFPVYRTYVSPARISDVDARYIDLAISLAKEKSTAADTSIFDFIKGVLLTNIAAGQDHAYRNEVMTFAMKFQQFTGPVMAKGLEDTAFYRYNRLVSLNEVGSDPERFGVTVEEFHAANQERIRNWPATMLATSTHDSKRSEDVRTRLDVISEISGLWRLRVSAWRRSNRAHKRVVNDRSAPSRNDEYLLYQTLVGAWPPNLSIDSDKADWQSFSERVEGYMLKAIREAKTDTSWINRNEAYEEATVGFVKKLLNPGPKNRFLPDFLPFQRRISRIGLWNSLSQTLLKLTCPGVPDIYQGNDAWDFSLVDPDNRRPVDFAHRQRILEDVCGWSAVPDATLLEQLLNTPQDDRLKLYLTSKTLCLRRQHPHLFQEGEYLPVAVSGTRSDHVLAFVRKYENTRVLVVAPRLVVGLLNDHDIPPTGAGIWNDTQLTLSRDDYRRPFRNVFTGEPLDFGRQARVADVLASFPVGLCLEV